MVKGVPSLGMGLFFLWVFGFQFSVFGKGKKLLPHRHNGHRENTNKYMWRQGTRYQFFNRKLKTGNRKPHFRAFTPAAVERIRPGR